VQVQVQAQAQTQTQARLGLPSPEWPEGMQAGTCDIDGRHRRCPPETAECWTTLDTSKRARLNQWREVTMVHRVPSIPHTTQALRWLTRVWLG